MPKLSSHQRALEAIALFEKHGREVKSVTLLKHGEVKIDFVSSDDEEYNSLDHIDFKLYKPEKKPRRGSLEALQERKRQEKEK